MKLLFVCSRNRRRSLTAERIYDGRAGIRARSTGTQPEARVVVTEGHIGWADLIVCMEKSHLSRLRLKFPEAMKGKAVACLHLRDEFEFMQEELVAEIQARLEPALGAYERPECPER